MMTVAIVLAGGQKTGLIKNDESKVLKEALVPIGRRYMIEYVIDAIRGSERIDRIIVAGPVREMEKVLCPDPAVSLVPSGPTTVDSFCNAFEKAGVIDGYLLVVTGDVPLLTTQAVDDFLESCLKREGDIFYPIVSKEENESKYPGVRRTYVKLLEGTYTGGNLILINPAVVRKCIPVARQLVRLRKKPFMLASYIGWGVLLKYICGCLTVSDAEKKLSRLMGVRAVAIVSPFAEIGIDVDKSSDLALVERVLSS